MGSLTSQSPSSLGVVDTSFMVVSECVQDFQPQDIHDGLLEVIGTRGPLSYVRQDTCRCLECVMCSSPPLPSFNSWLSFFYSRMSVTFCCSVRWLFDLAAGGPSTCNKGIHFASRWMNHELGLVVTSLVVMEINFFSWFRVRL